MRKIVIAVDGFAATGKGTLSQAIAHKYNITYIDSGAFYRCLSLETINHPEKDVHEILRDVDIDIRGDKLFLDNEDVTSRIRDRDVTNQIDKIVNIPEVRSFVTNLVRNIASSRSVVADGRDVGNNILPNANLKFLLVADEDERARRRVEQYKEKGIIVSFDEIKKDNKLRDDRDALNMGNIERIVIDDTSLDVNETLKKVSKYIDAYLAEGDNHE